MHRYSRDLRPGYPLKPAMLIDFFSFLPFLLELTATNQSVPGLTFLRLLRVSVPEVSLSSACYGSEYLRGL